MVSVLTLPKTAAPASSTGGSRKVWFLPGCTALALLLLGYHPHAEDGGIYTAAIAARLQPSLLPSEHAFAVGQSGRSLFVPLLAFVAKTLPLPLSVVLLMAYVASLAATLWAAQVLLRQVFVQERSQRWAVLLLAVTLGLPVAGTSLYLADPYLTARSLSTPLLLLGLAWLLQRRYVAVLVLLVGAAAVHPIMALCSLPVFMLCMAVRQRSPGWIAACAAVTATCMVAVWWFGAADMPAARAASLTRLYWFPWQWEPYEWLGALAPPAVLLLLHRKASARLSPAGQDLLLALACASLLVVVCTCCLVHTGNQSLLLARLQPLRLLHLLYCVFLPVLGGWLGSSRRWRTLPLAAAVVAAGGLLLMQRSLYRHSGHIELPGATSRNGYVQAFVWVRANTPPNALFALDADYTRAPGEDAQLFRAVALRSALPDAAKDGGVASILPALAPEWERASQAQQGLATLPDSARLRRVLPLGATWIVLPASSTTALACPYRNVVAQVCQLR